MIESEFSEDTSEEVLSVAGFCCGRCERWSDETPGEGKNEAPSSISDDTDGGLIVLPLASAPS